MFEITKKEDFKNFKLDITKELIFCKIMKIWFNDFLDNIEETNSIEKYGKFFYMEQKSDFKNNEKLGLSQDIKNSIYESTDCYKIILNDNKEMIIYNTLFLFNNDYGINIFYTKDDVDEDIFNYLTSDIDEKEIISYDLNLKVLL